MSFGDGMAALQQAAKKLNERFDESKEGWNDAARQQFEEEHLEALRERLKSTVTGLTSLAEAFARYKQQCS